jgi:hypothetical protein
MDAIFQNTGAEAPAVEATAQNTEKKAKLNAMKAAFKETVQTDPGFTEKLHRLSDSVKVLNTLGYGKGGNIVVDKSAKAAESGERQLTQTSQIVGYKLQNIGSEAIEYTTEVWQKGADGKFTSSVVTKSFAPGETIVLSRKYMTMFCAVPEISFTLANGRVSLSSKKAKNFDEELASYYFTFNKNEDGTTIQVNDDEVKLAIDVDNVVKDEYLETFGYLNNPKEARLPKAKGAKVTAQDLAANYVARMIAEQGIQ